MKKFLLAWLFIFALPFSAHAHALWVNLTDWSPVAKKDGLAFTRMYIGWGHHYPVDGLTDRNTFAGLTLLRPDGQKEDISLESEGISSAAIHAQKEGLYLVSAIRKHSVNTTYRENGQLKKSKGPKSQFKNVVQSIYSQQFATALFRVGNKETSLTPPRNGNTLELLPLADPYADQVNYMGKEFPVQLLLDGKPLPYTQVTATHAGFSSGDAMAQRVLTDARGIAHIRITHWGPWLLKAKVERPAQGKILALADTEVYYTSLTFEIN